MCRRRTTTVWATVASGSVLNRATVLVGELTFGDAAKSTDVIGGIAHRTFVGPGVVVRVRRDASRCARSMRHASTAAPAGHGTVRQEGRRVCGARVIGGIIAIHAMKKTGPGRFLLEPVGALVVLVVGLSRYGIRRRVTIMAPSPRSEP